jgi:hypothetical protein
MMPKSAQLRMQQINNRFCAAIPDWRHWVPGRCDDGYAQVVSPVTERPCKRGLTPLNPLLEMNGSAPPSTLPIVPPELPFVGLNAKDERIGYCSTRIAPTEGSWQDRQSRLLVVQRLGTSSTNESLRPTG